LAGFIEKRGYFYILKSCPNRLSWRFDVSCHYKLRLIVDLSSTNEDTNQNTKSVYESLLRRIANYFKANIMLERTSPHKKKNNQIYVIEV
jgi:hypothetical protein